MRSPQEIEAEIKALIPAARDYDTEYQSNDTCVAAGAHDALRWVLGLAEQPVSECVKECIRADVMSGPDAPPTMEDIRRQEGM